MSTSSPGLRFFLGGGKALGLVRVGWIKGEGAARLQAEHQTSDPTPNPLSRNPACLSNPKPTHTNQTKPKPKPSAHRSAVVILQMEQLPLGDSTTSIVVGTTARALRPRGDVTSRVGALKPWPAASDSLDSCGGAVGGVAVWAGDGMGMGLMRGPALLQRNERSGWRRVVRCTAP